MFLKQKEASPFTFHELIALDLKNRTETNDQVVSLSIYKNFPFSEAELQTLQTNTDYLEVFIDIIRGGQPIPFGLLKKITPRARIFIWENLAHYQLENTNAIFTKEEIVELGDPLDNDERPLSLLQARKGHQFTWDEILFFREVKDRFGATIAHWSARNGRRFSLAELLTLGNPAIINYSDEVLQERWEHLNYLYYGVNERSGYQQKTYLLERGMTVAHIMAREGYQFTDEEIEQLGNPKDAAGLTIRAWQK